jgi:hypothetical protein
MNKVSYKVILVKQSEQKVKHFEEMKRENNFLSAQPALYWKTDKNEIYGLFRKLGIKVRVGMGTRFGVLAIWASNIRLWLDFLRKPEYRGKKYLVVFEDDVFLHKRFRNILQRRVIGTGLLKRSGGLLLSNRKGANFICVAYERKHIKRILMYLRMFGIRKPIDMQLLGWKIVRKTGLPLVSLNNRIVSERKKSGSIG